MRPEEFVDLVRKAAPAGADPTALATVDTPNAGGTAATVVFDGETVAAVREYPSVGYTPVAGDRVVLLRTGHGWVIVGKVSSGGATGGGNHPDADHADAFSALGHLHDADYVNEVDHTKAQHTALGLAADDHTHPAGAWTNVVFENGWVNHNTTQVAQYRKTVDGMVQFRGLIANGTVGLVTAIRMPEGYRPNAYLHQLIRTSGGVGSMRANGVITDGSSNDGLGSVQVWEGSNGWVDLSGFAYYADA